MTNYKQSTEERTPLRIQELTTVLTQCCQNLAGQVIARKNEFDSTGVLNVK